MTRGVDDWQRAANELVQRLDGQVKEIDTRLAEHMRVELSLRARRDAALQELLEALVPSLTPQALEQAARWTGYLSLTEVDYIAQMDADRRKLGSRNAEIDAEPAYVDREALRHPVTGRLTMELAELDNDMAPLASFLGRAKHERLARLMTNGYGTNAYDVPWWRVSYYSDWKAGDEVLEQFADKNWESFGEFRRHYDDVKQAADAFREKRTGVRTEINTGIALEKERTANQATLDTLEESYLGIARAKVEGLLGDTGPAPLADRLSAVPGVELLAKRWAGLHNQVLTLNQLRATMLDEPKAALQKDLSKLRRKQVKYRRPKKRYTTFSDDEFERTFRDRSDKYRKRWDRYNSGFGYVSSFDRYDEGSLHDDHLWWDTFSDGRESGNYLAEVKRYRQRHPDYRYRRPKRAKSAYDDEAAAAAVANANMSDDDDLFDGS